MLQFVRKLGTPSSLCDFRMRRISSCPHDVVFPEWARKSVRGLHWSTPEPQGRDIMLRLFCTFRAPLVERRCFTEGRLLLPCPRGGVSMNALSLSHPQMGHPLGSGYRVELDVS